MSRAKNTATAEDVRRALKGAVSSLANEKYKSADLVCIVDSYVEAILDVLRLTPRPCLSILKAGAVLAFSGDGNSVEECELLGSRLYDAISMCKHKVKSMSTGKKLEPSVFKVCSFLKKVDAQSTSLISSKSKSSKSLSSGRVKPQPNLESTPVELKGTKRRLSFEDMKAQVHELYGITPGGSSASVQPRLTQEQQETLVVESSQEAYSPLRPAQNRAKSSKPLEDLMFFMVFI